jgi:hypothetical protein
MTTRQTSPRPALGDRGYLSRVPAELVGEVASHLGGRSTLALRQINSFCDDATMRSQARTWTTPPLAAAKTSVDCPACTPSELVALALPR